MYHALPIIKWSWVLLHMVWQHICGLCHSHWYANGTLPTMTSNCNFFHIQSSFHWTHVNFTFHTFYTLSVTDNLFCNSAIFQSTVKTGNFQVEVWHLADMTENQNWMQEGFKSSTQGQGYDRVTFASFTVHHLQCKISALLVYRIDCNFTTPITGLSE